METLPGLEQKEIKLAKFVTYQHDDGVWFHLSRPDETNIVISLRAIQSGNTQTLNIKLSEAYALRGLLNMILERGT